MNWSALTTREVLSRLHASESGLGSQVVLERREKYGENILPQPPTPTILSLFLSQFTNPLVFVLLLAALLIYAIHGFSDSVIILIVLLFNACIGTYQEYHSQQTLAGLKRLVTTVAHVIRDGVEIEIPDKELVPGDIISVREGEKVPADCRLIQVESLRTDESSLTGESVPVDKTTDTVQVKNATIGDKRNMIFRGTTVTLGFGKAIVTSIGTQTVIGSLAIAISKLDTNVPLAHKIKRLSQTIVMSVAAAVILFFAISLFKGQDFVESLITAISMVVALIPEGLPVILTLVLATSVARMSRRHVLVKRLQAVEALGSASIIAVDKTGTITLNQLAVQEIVTVDQKTYTVSGKGFDTAGSFFLDGKKLSYTSDHKTLERLLSLLKSSTAAYVHSVGGVNTPVGDPTEIACVVAVKKYPAAIGKLKRVFSVPFEYHAKYSSHLFVDEKENYTIARVGAADVILRQCTLSTAIRKTMDAKLEQMQQKGLRVIAVASYRLSNKPNELTAKIFSNSSGFELNGLVGMQDTIQVQAKDAIASATNAGLRVVMITGDHAQTAKAIAKQVGIYKDGDHVLTGDEVEELTDAELQQTIHTSTVFARVTPEHKLRIIQALRHNNETVAMTGDGVNDAASLVAADLGIAMGVTGTEVAKDAADIVLLDDNFSSITAAIEEGRSLYLTIKNVVVYLLSSSAGEAFTLFGTVLLGFSSPISPAQIIWLNFVTDGFLDVALSFEPHEKNIVRRGWNHSSTDLVDRQMLYRILLTGACMAVGSVFVFTRVSGISGALASTMTLTTLAAFQWFHAWNCRSQKLSLTALSPFANRPLILATITVFILQMVALYTPLFQRLLHTTPLSVMQWVICLGIASTVIIVDELRKSILQVHTV